MDYEDLGPAMRAASVEDRLKLLEGDAKLILAQISEIVTSMNLLTATVQKDLEARLDGEDAPKD